MIKDIKDLDRKVAQAAEIQFQLSKLDSELEQKIAALRDTHAKVTQPLKRKFDKIEEEVIKYGDTHPIWNGKKKLELTCGRLRFTTPKGRIEVKDEDTLIRNLKDAKYDYCIKVTETVIKTDLKKLPEDEWEELGFSLVKDDPELLLEIDLSKWALTKVG